MTNSQDLQTRGGHMGYVTHEPLSMLSFDVPVPSNTHVGKRYLLLNRAPTRA